jgi:hypothetical protein
MYNVVSTQFVTKLGGLLMVTYIVVKRSKDNGKSTPIFLQKKLPLWISTFQISKHVYKGQEVRLE